MLRKYVYLDKATLAEYIATLEGGLIAETRSRSKRASSKGGKVNIRVAEGALSGDDEDEHQWTMSDSPESQMERLLDVANDAPDTIGWIEVMSPDSELPDARVGEFVSWECDAYIPDVARLLATDGDAAKKLGLFGPLLRVVAEGGLSIGKEGKQLTPEQKAEIEQWSRALSAADELLQSVNGKRSVIGEDSGTEWQIFGALAEEHLRVDDIDDERLVIVGKVKRRLAKGRSQPIMGIVGLDMPSRAERRKREMEPPPAGKEDEYISGPALELEILAIYR